MLYMKQRRCSWNIYRFREKGWRWRRDSSWRRMLHLHRRNEQVNGEYWHQTIMRPVQDLLKTHRMEDGKTNERDFWIETSAIRLPVSSRDLHACRVLHAPRERAHASVASEATRRHQRHCWIRHHSFHRRLPNTEQIVTIFSHQWVIKLRSSQLMATIWITTFQRPSCFQLHQDDFDVSKMRHQRESGLSVSNSLCVPAEVAARKKDFHRKVAQNNNHCCREMQALLVAILWHVMVKRGWHQSIYYSFNFTINTQEGHF